MIKPGRPTIYDRFYHMSLEKLKGIQNESFKSSPLDQSLRPLL